MKNLLMWIYTILTFISIGYLSWNLNVVDDMTFCLILSNFLFWGYLTTFKEYKSNPSN
ncbi:hypothetical protein H3018_gp41 [Bacillus phage DK3]|uniref:Uncharacterized protein n=1 Tax=Bacillus phage DK3 TaxID=2500810 RepID=A0A3T0IJA3_9CAUD|nr:hypothetical protein H3018_gp41 [Bacillus phage DK3]AZU99839.1 hypothetical protein DK3_000041 [Bacillus phage DK3]